MGTIEQNVWNFDFILKSRKKFAMPFVQNAWQYFVISSEALHIPLPIPSQLFWYFSSSDKIEPGHKMSQGMLKKNEK